MMKKICLALLGLCLIVSCASLNGKENLGWEKLLARSIGIAASVASPESSAALNGVCIASGLNDQDVMISALQKLWTGASDAQATAVVEGINDLVGATKIMDGNATQTQLAHWQEVLGSMCSGAELGKGTSK